MQQEYRRRADAAGTADKVVQRAMRGLGHCDFTLAEEEEAFDAVVLWVATGRRPAGDQHVVALFRKAAAGRRAQALLGTDAQHDRLRLLRHLAPRDVTVPGTLRCGGPLRYGPAA